jgi:hypothetical protein
MKNICHIIGISFDSKDGYELDHNYSIRPLSSVEDKVLRDLYRIRQVHSFYLNEWPFCIDFKKKLQLPSIIPAEFPIDVYNIIIPMWIFSGKAVTPFSLIFYDEDKSNLIHAISNNNILKNSQWLHADCDLIKFKQFFNSLNKSSFCQKDIYIRYFAESMCEEKLEDKLIKLTIAMENILLPKEKLELSNKFATRAAFILSDEYEERKEIYKFFKKMYSERSKIVHGDIEKANLTREELKKYFDYCRKIICLYIENKNKNLWNKKLLEDISLGKNAFEGENSLNRNLANLIME